ncbi:MAG: sugar phosphate isomerase/epimerase [Planctomycetales bacterium]|nr:sugar phosphate isomerase/epimerase [Planctomycetales bacterium]
MDLCPGRIGVKLDQEELIDLAAEFGFESVEPFEGALLGKNQEQIQQLTDKLKKNGLVWGAAGMSVDFRSDETTFKQGLQRLPAVARSFQQAGVTRVGTWLRPSHHELTYLSNFRQHVGRLREIAKVLADHDLRFGLEYVGPRTSWSAGRYAFIHTLAETQELLAEIGQANMGLVLDSWHWYTAEEDAAALRKLSNSEVVAVDLNDAPSAVDVREQIDNRRELPVATGVIDVKSFLNALVAIGYDGPIRAEPFNKALNELENRDAIQATAKAMSSAFAQIG